MTAPTSALSVSQVIDAIERELRGVPDREHDTPRGSLDRAVALQRAFRAAPVGGRLAGLKRVVHWWVASAFDRQAKVVEALLEELAARSEDQRRLEARVAELEDAVGRLSSGAEERE